MGMWSGSYWGSRYWADRYWPKTGLPPVTERLRLLPARMWAGTAARLAAANPLLSANELGTETDTQRAKVGDGTTRWNSLPYLGGAGWRWEPLTNSNPASPALVFDGDGDCVMVAKQA